MRMSFLWAGAYFIAAVLVITPLLDVSVAAMPFRPGDLTWRFGAIGIFAEGVFLALSGLFLALVLAVSFEHRAMVRFMGVVCTVGFVLFVAIIGLFLVEVLAVRSIVPDEGQTGFRIASVLALFKHVCGAVGTGLGALAARSEAKRLQSSGGGGKREMVFSAGKG